MAFKKGDIVARRSYNCDILFRIVNVQAGEALLAGEEMRLLADAPLEDLVLVTEREQRKYREQAKKAAEDSYKLFRQDAKLMKQRNDYEMKQLDYFELRGRVLHLDGDPLYLQKCMELYERLGVPVYGVHTAEKSMPEQIGSLLEIVRPDIVVITGHDAYLKTKGDKDDIRAYRNSKYFAECVRIAREFMTNRDELVIFAGACQSHFERLIKAGANFASSPDRVNIHALDPVYVVSFISLTSFVERVRLYEMLRNTMTGEEGIGGIETKGVMRRGFPLKIET